MTTHNNRYELRDAAVKALLDDVLLLSCRWEQFLQLFASEANIAVFRDVAPVLFGDVQHGLWVDVVLGACRLLDSQKGAASIRTVMHEVDTELVPPQRAELQQLLKVAAQAMVPLKTLRDEIFAHRSARTSELRIHWAHQREVQHAVESLTALVNALNRAARPAHDMPTSVDCNHDAHSLLRVLNLGVSTSRSARSTGDA